MADILQPYGPQRPWEPHDYVMFKTPKYLSNYSKKILLDLVYVARLVSGRKIHLISLAHGERCTQCTNSVTGEVVLSDCPMCHGTGYVRAWDYMGIYYTYVDFSPKYEIATDNGTVNNPGGAKDAINVLGAPPIHDQDLIYFEETKELFKVYDSEPLLAAIRGDVVIQTAQASRLEPGCAEYRALEVIPSCFSL